MISIIPVIVGPTAIGKTSVALSLAQKINAEIISADSMQVYRHLSIGTAKPTISELGGIPYHLIDHVEPIEQYNLGRFITEADALINSLTEQRKRVILCGGTGLYIRGLIYGVFDGGERDPFIRKILEHDLQQIGLPALYQELLSVDPVSAQNYGSNDRQRIVRALEVYRSTGRPFSSTHRQDYTRPRYPVITFYLTDTRENLYARINQRVDSMLESGLLEEVREFLLRFGDLNNPALNALGYRKIIQALNGEIPMEAGIAAMKQKSRNYAKRQETWFRSIKGAIIIPVTDKSPDAIANEIIAFIENN